MHMLERKNVIHKKRTLKKLAPLLTYYELAMLAYYDSY